MCACVNFLLRDLRNRWLAAALEQKRQILSTRTIAFALNALPKQSAERFAF